LALRPSDILGNSRLYTLWAKILTNLQIGRLHCDLGNCRQIEGESLQLLDFPCNLGIGHRRGRQGAGARGEGATSLSRFILLLAWMITVSTVYAEQSVQDWNKHRQSLLDSMQQVMGQLPGKEKRCPLEIKILEEVSCHGYVRRLIAYQSEPGSRVTAYLLVPDKAVDGKEKCPAVLCLHPTDDLIGHQKVTGLGDKPTRQYAKQLAERGYVTLAPSYPLLANYKPDLEQLGYVSGTMKAIWDNIRAIDLLEVLPYVEQSGVGAIGHSLGGHNAVYTAVFDQRIKVIVSSCGLDSYKDYMNGDILDGWTPERYKERRPSEDG
jgi:hypothetical protein